MSESLDNVRVIVRVRPLSSKELDGPARKCITVVSKSSLILEIKPEPKRFTYDYVASEATSQAELFEEVGRSISLACLNGYNGTIFAYGQTGAGKTFTIQGPGFDPNKAADSSSNLRGLLPRCYEFIFERIEEAKASGSDFVVRCSYLEIYQEQIIDLLSPESRILNIREDLKRGVYVEGLIETQVTNSAETFEVLQIGARNRHVSSTSMNLESSRSHSVFTMLIESKTSEGGLVNFRSSRFHLIDLAGSERQKLTDAAGDRIKEAGMINKSLSALGNVINSLVDISEGRSRHVHYRDSKLTFLLKDSLGGNSKTCIVAAANPSLVYLTETLSTLKFAQRAKLIKNRAVVNEDASGAVGILKEEVRRLKEELTKHKQAGCLAIKQCQRCGETTDEQRLDFKEQVHKTPETTWTTPKDSYPTPKGSQNTSTEYCGASKNQGSLQPESRVFQLESLLDHNLRLRFDNEARLQNEIDQKTSQLQSYETALARLEKKISNDKMVLKFRDSTIARFQGSKPIVFNEEMEALRQELQVVREQLEVNPTAAKLFAENKKLRHEIEGLKDERGPDASAKIKELEEFTRKLADMLMESLAEQAQAREALAEMAQFRFSETINSSGLGQFREDLEDSQSETELKLEILQEELGLIEKDNQARETMLRHKLSLQAKRIEELSIENEQLAYALKAFQQGQQYPTFNDKVKPGLEAVKSASSIQETNSPNSPILSQLETTEYTEITERGLKQADSLMSSLYKRGIASFVLSMSPVESCQGTNMQDYTPIRNTRDIESSPFKHDLVETYSSPFKIITNTIGLSPTSEAREVEKMHIETEEAYVLLKTHCNELKKELAQSGAYSLLLESRINELVKAKDDQETSSISAIAMLESKLTDYQLQLHQIQMKSVELEDEKTALRETIQLGQSQCADLQVSINTLQYQVDTLTYSSVLAEQRLLEALATQEQYQGAHERTETELKLEKNKSSQLQKEIKEAEEKKHELIDKLQQAAVRDEARGDAMKEILKLNERLIEELQTSALKKDKDTVAESQLFTGKLEAVDPDITQLSEGLIHDELVASCLEDRLPCRNDSEFQDTTEESGSIPIKFIYAGESNSEMGGSDPL